VFKGFVAGKNAKYEQLKGEAMRLGSAFQKVNFLRDLKEDNLNRNYFPGVDLNSFDEEAKNSIIRKLKRILGCLRRNCKVASKQNLSLYSLCLL
jgi:phytoene/squalene synthetase